MFKVGDLPRAAIPMAVGVALAAVTLAGQQGGLSTPPLDAALSGTVVDALTGRPLPDAVVALSTEDFGQPRRQQTDAIGRFVYPELLGGLTYVIRASRNGYLSSVETPSAVVRVALGAGQWARNVHVSLWPPAAISGTVLDDHGDPVVGAHVRVLLKTKIGERDRLVAGPVAATDDLGRYRIGGLIKGTYVVALVSVSESVPNRLTQGALNNLSPESAAGRAAEPPVIGARAGGDGGVVLLVGRHNTEREDGAIYPGQYFPGVADAASAEAVTIDYGEERRGVGFSLRRVPAWRVSGTVHGPQDEISDLSLRLVPVGSEGLGIGSETAITKPSPDGRFVFLAVPSGQYALLAASRVGEFLLEPAILTRRLLGAQSTNVSSVSATSAPVLFGWSGSSNATSWGRRTVIVDDRNVDGVDVDVVRGAVISGQLVLDSTSTMPPATRTAALVIEPSLDNEWLMSSHVTVTDSTDGAPAWSAPRVFEIRGLTPGRYYLRTNMKAAVIKSIAWGGRDYTNDPIDVSAGGPSDVTVTITTRVATLLGSVQLPVGATNVGTAVVCFPVDPTAWQKFALNPSRIRSAPTDSRGNFRFDGLQEGDYFAVAVPDTQRDGWRDPRFLESAARVATRVHLTWGTTVSQVLRLETVRTQ